jgi:ParB-like chromosome segregation protein Spo0J
MYAPDGKTPQGVLKICIGWRNPETGKVEISDGRQRTLAAREAKKRLKKQGLPPIRLPVHLKRANDSQLMAMMITANEHATEDSPMNRANKAQRYISLGHDEREVAIMFGTSESTVKNLLRLLDAPAAVRNAVDAGKITASDAYKLSREEPEEARKKLGKLLEQAPRTPGKKRSKNASKAREIVRGGAGGGARVEKPNALDRSILRSEKIVEDAAAASIADWIEKNWNDADWNGSPKAIPERIRAGEWRERAKGDAA